MNFFCDRKIFRSELIFAKMELTNNAADENDEIFISNFYSLNKINYFTI